MGDKARCPRCCEDYLMSSIILGHDKANQRFVEDNAHSLVFNGRKATFRGSEMCLIGMGFTKVGIWLSVEAKNTVSSRGESVLRTRQNTQG